MAGNRKIKKSKAVDERLSPVTPASAKKRAEELKQKLHRIEVDLVATRRMSLEQKLQSYNTLPPPDVVASRSSEPERLPLAQIQELKKMLYYKLAECFFTLILIAGISAWLYKWWLLKTGP